MFIHQNGGADGDIGTIHAAAGVCEAIGANRGKLRVAQDGDLPLRSAIEGFRPKATNIAKLSQEDYQSQKRATAKIEAAISASEASPQDTHELKELIERLMVNTVSK